MIRDLLKAAGKMIEDRRAVIVTLACSVLLMPLGAVAQQARNRPRIGYLGTGTPSGSSRLLAGFLDELRERGWVDGRNLTIEYRWAASRLDRLPNLAGELVKLKVDLLVAIATPGAQAARQSTATIPIVMVGVGDPVALGYVASLARPGGNVTGVSSMSVDLGPKRLELLKESIPTLSRVHVMWNPGDPARAVEVNDTRAAAERLGLGFNSIQVRTLSDIERAFAATLKDRHDALIVQQDPLTFANRARIAELALKSRTPAISPFREFPEDGGLMAYGANLMDLYRRAAVYVDKILRGALPGELPVEQPSKFELVINLRTASALGLTIPRSVLLRADQVIE